MGRSEVIWCDSCGKRLPQQMTASIVFQFYDPSEKQTYELCHSCAGRIKAEFTKRDAYVAVTKEKQP